MDSKSLYTKHTLVKSSPNIFFTQKTHPGYTLFEALYLQEIRGLLTLVTLNKSIKLTLNSIFCDLTVECLEDKSWT